MVLKIVFVNVYIMLLCRSLPVLLGRKKNVRDKDSELVSRVL